MTLLRMLAFRPAGAAASGSGLRRQRRVAATARAERRRCAPTRPRTIVRRGRRPARSTGARGRASSAISSHGAARQLATNCALIEHRGNTLQLALDRARSRARRRRSNRLAQALRNTSAGACRVEFVDGARRCRNAGAGRRAALGEALDAARRALEADPTVREMKARFGATLHPESVRPTESKKEEITMRGGSET